MKPKTLYKMTATKVLILSCHIYYQINLYSLWTPKAALFDLT